MAKGIVFEHHGEGPLTSALSMTHSSEAQNNAKRTKLGCSGASYDFESNGRGLCRVSVVLPFRNAAASA